MTEFDVAVLMGTHSQTVFDEYVQLHPGAKRLNKFWLVMCQCGEANCLRSLVQTVLSPMVDHDPDLVLAWLNKLRGFEPLTEMEFHESTEWLGEEYGAKYPDRYAAKTRAHIEGKQSEGMPDIKQILEEAFPGMTVIEITPEPPTRH